MTHQQPNALQD